MIVLQIPEEVWEALPEPPEKACPNNPLGRGHSDDRYSVYFFDESGRQILYTSGGWVIVDDAPHFGEELAPDDVNAGPFPTLDGACVAWKLGL